MEALQQSELLNIVFIFIILNTPTFLTIAELRRIKAPEKWYGWSLTPEIGSAYYNSISLEQMQIEGEKFDPIQHP